MKHNMKKFITGTAFFKDYKDNAFEELGRSDFFLNRFFHALLDRMLPNRYLMTRQQFISALKEVTHKKNDGHKNGPSYRVRRFCAATL